MLSSVVSSILFAGVAVASVSCPIKPYDASPGYQIACVYGDANGVNENQLVKDIDVVGTMFAATLPFECIRQEPNAKWLAYNLDGRICWVTEGNVSYEDANPCIAQLSACSQQVIEGIPETGEAEPVAEAAAETGAETAEPASAPAEAPGLAGVAALLGQLAQLAPSAETAEETA